VSQRNYNSTRSARVQWVSGERYRAVFVSRDQSYCGKNRPRVISRTPFFQSTCVLNCSRPRTGGLQVHFHSMVPSGPFRLKFSFMLCSLLLCAWDLRSPGRNCVFRGGTDAPSGHFWDVGLCRSISARCAFLSRADAIDISGSVD
jgi:hypothetical protein